MQVLKTPYSNKGCVEMPPTHLVARQPHERKIVVRPAVAKINVQNRHTIPGAVVAHLLQKPGLTHVGRGLDEHDGFGRFARQHFQETLKLLVAVYKPVNVIGHESSLDS